MSKTEILKREISALGQYYRNDWSDFDGRTLRDELDSIMEWFTDETKTEEDLIKFEAKLKDRFGAIPRQTIELMDAIRLRREAMQAGFEKIVLKNSKLVAYFISKQNSPYYQTEIFKRILNFEQKNPHKCKMKEANNKLTLVIENVKTIDEESLTL